MTINTFVLTSIFAIALLGPSGGVDSALAASEDPAIVSELKVTTLSTMLTEFRGGGEWGFAALVEADGQTILFDTGMRPDTVLKNAEELGVDLSSVDTVILSHNHFVLPVKNIVSSLIPSFRRLFSASSVGAK